MFIEILMFITGVILGWLGNRYYYIKQKKETKEQTQDIKRIKEILEINFVETNNPEEQKTISELKIKMCRINTLYLLTTHIIDSFLSNQNIEGEVFVMVNNESYFLMKENLEDVKLFFEQNKNKIKHQDNVEKIKSWIAHWDNYIENYNENTFVE
jgi:hypothetical protein